MDFPVSKFSSYEHPRNRPNKNVHHLSRGYSKIILNQLHGDQEIALRTGVESQNHLEATSAQTEVCTDNTKGYSP